MISYSEIVNNHYRSALLSGENPPYDISFQSNNVFSGATPLDWIDFQLSRQNTTFIIRMNGTGESKWAIFKDEAIFQRPTLTKLEAIISIMVPYKNKRTYEKDICFTNCESYILFIIPLSLYNKELFYLTHHHKILAYDQYRQCYPLFLFFFSLDFYVLHQEFVFLME